MANSVALVTMFRRIVDELYKKSSLTARLDSQSMDITDFANANVVKIMKISTPGLGTYSRATGYPAGEATITWESLTLATERGRKFHVDAMDNEETLGLMMGALAGDFMRTKVVPEMDAYRFATLAGWSGVGEATSATLTKDTVLAAIDVAKAALNTAEAPDEGRILYVLDDVGIMIEQALTRMWANGGNIDRRVNVLDGIDVVKVPAGRFYSAITLDAGATGSAGGFTQGAGKQLNFILLHPSAVKQAVKHQVTKILGPEQNPDADAYILNYRLYHDQFVYTQKVGGVYVHHQA